MAPMKSTSILMLGAILAIGAPAVAERNSAHSTQAQRREINLILLNARLASVNARIAVLRQEQLISREEALDLRDESRGLVRRLMGRSARDTKDIEFELGRLENKVRFAMDDASGARHVFAGREERRIDMDRYREARDPNYEHFDRYTGSSVDRWHDPFDRGN